MKNSQGLANLWSAVYSPGFLLSFAVKDCYKENEILTEVSYLQGLMSAKLLWYEHWLQGTDSINPNSQCSSATSAVPVLFWKWQDVWRGYD